MTKIYLAVPYSGMEESSYQQANEAMIKLLEKGNVVYSPITSSHVTTLSPNEIPQTWDFWWNIDRNFIDWADEVWVLVPRQGIDAVVSSRGVTDEVVYALDRGMTVKYFYIAFGSVIIAELDHFFLPPNGHEENRPIDWIDADPNQYDREGE